jgi:hypothetical protein
MPWASRPNRKDAGARLRRGLRRWRYDHSEGLRSFWIGAAIVGAALAVVTALRALG